MGVLQITDVVKHYEGGGEPIRAVDGVSLRIDPGELVAICGPSGSGKTTLLLLAAALLTPDSGTVSFSGRLLAGLSETERSRYLLRDVGLVAQSFGMRGGLALSALDNACLKLLADGYSLREARPIARVWLERVGLGARAEHAPRQLSMGERQRLAIARALANEPGLILADEPTGNLDSTRSAEILGLLREVCRERGIPGMLVTHDAQAQRYVDRLLTLKDGHLHEGQEVAAAVLGLQR